MAKAHAAGCRPARDERALLRGAVLRLGGMLGWRPAEVIALAEALTGRPWRRLATGDFRLVLEEYAGLVETLEVKASKHQRGAEAAAPPAMRGGENAVSR